MIGGKEFTNLDGVGASVNPANVNIDLSNLNFSDRGRPAAGGDRSPATGANAISDTHFDDAPMSGVGNNIYEYEYSPTPLNPAKTDRFLIENVFLSAALLFNMIMGIASAATDQMTYLEPLMRMRINAGFIQSCLSGECQNYPVFTVFCTRYLNNASGFLACIIISILVSLVAFIFSICNLCGRVCVSKYLVIALSLIAWIFLLSAVICVATLRTTTLCNGTSLASLGFKFGPSFPLCLTSLIVLALVILFYWVKRCVRPAKYRY